MRTSVSEHLLLPTGITAALEERYTPATQNEVDTLLGTSDSEFSVWLVVRLGTATVLEQRLSEYRTGTLDRHGDGGTTPLEAAAEALGYVLGSGQAALAMAARGPDPRNYVQGMDGR